MAIKTVRGLEDIEGLRQDDFVEVHFEVETGERRNIPLINTGIFYRRIPGGFSTVGYVLEQTNDVIARIDYSWDSSNRTFTPSVDLNNGLFSDMAEHQRYEKLLKKLSEEIRQAT